MARLLRGAVCANQLGHHAGEFEMSAELPRAQRKLLRAVADLHLRGYQRLRISPYIGGPGAWRCTIAPAHYFSSRHGALLADNAPHERLAHYTSASDSEYWEWKDAHHCSPTHLAEVFLERFPEVAREGYGPDWLYAGWYQDMLHRTYPDALPIASDDYWDDLDYIRLEPGGRRMPVPPPGYALDAFAPR